MYSGFVFIDYVIVYYYYHMCDGVLHCLCFVFTFFFWCPCMAINVSVHPVLSTCPLDTNEERRILIGPW